MAKQLKKKDVQLNIRWNGEVNEKEIKRVTDLIGENKIEIIDLKFNDLPGLWQHFSIPASELYEIDDPLKSIWVEGIGFDGSSIRGFQKIQESDMILQLDPSTAVVDPICEVPTLSIICDIYDPLTKKPYTRDPRYIAKKASRYLRSTGIADIRWSFLFLMISVLTSQKIAVIILSIL